MYIDKPPWVVHAEGRGQRSPIFSIDVHPHTSRLATAGQDHKVKIWNLIPLLRHDYESDAATPKLLATLADHSAPVNVTRFSPDGRFISSGSDDSLVCVWEYREGPGRQLFGSTDGPNVENWTLTHPLRGHSSHVTDIAWSPDSKMLASCSLDNLVLIWWPAGGDRLRTLRGHTSFVKGVAWDPVGTFLASQSDDRSVLIWRVEDWTPAARVTTPLTGAVRDTFHYRPAWSPVGHNLAIVNSFTDSCHQCALIARGQTEEGWKKDFSYVGHSGVVTVARYNPQLFKNTENSGVVDTCIALGSNDRRFSVWLTRNRPILVGEKHFQRAVSDAAWTPDGYTLFVCSLDGTIACIQFEKSELGATADDSQVQELTRSMYGEKRIAQVLAESAEDLDLEGPGSKVLQDTTAKLTSRIAPASGTTTLSFSAQTLAPAPPAAAAAAARPAPGVGSASHAVPGRGSGVAVQLDGSRSALAADASGSGRSGAPLLALSPPATPRFLQVQLGQRPASLDSDGRDEVVLQIRNRSAAGPSGAAAAEPGSRSHVVCMGGKEVLWRDQVAGDVVLACGNMNFAMLALASRHLLVLSPCGRRLLPPMSLSAVPVLATCDSSWTAAVLSSDANVRCWDLQAMAIRTDCSAAPVLSQDPDRRVLALSLSADGQPLLVLDNHTSFWWHAGLASWMCVADGAHSAHSAFSCTLPGLAPSSELSRLQVAAAASAGGLSASLHPSNGALEAADTRAHLEHLMATAQLMKAPQDYRRWMLTYVRVAAQQGDHGRLRELCQSLLLPPSDLDGPAMGVLEPPPLPNPSPCSEAAEGMQSGKENISGEAPHGSLEAEVLGIPKRRLLHDVLAEMKRARSSSSAVTRLFQEFRELYKAQTDDSGPAWQQAQLR